MPQVPHADIKARAARLRAIGSSRLSAHLDSQIGRKVEVLMERGNRGRTPDFTEVAIPAPHGHLIAARITGRSGDGLLGEAHS